MVDNNTGLEPNHERELLKYNFAVAPSSSGEEAGSIKEQDRLLPIANVGRVMKQILPQNAKISKEAKETIQECVSEFISFVTGEASDRCHKEKRKTVNGDDVCWALESLGFDDFTKPMKRYLNRYRELEGERAYQNKTNNNNYEDNKKNDEKQSYKGESNRNKSTTIYSQMDENRNSFTRRF